MALWLRRAGVRALGLALAVFGLLAAGVAAGGQQEKLNVPVNPFRDVRDKTILVLSPHPDEDFVGCAGALAFLAGRANRLTIVYLTAGEKATFDSHMQAETFRKIRMEEAAAAYRSLGFSDADLIWLNYEHGELDAASPREVRERLVQIIRKIRPHLAFALDPVISYQGDNEPDRRAAARLGADALRATERPLAYPKTGLAYRVPEVYYFYPDRPTLQLDISEMYERKLASLARIQSQFPPALYHLSHGHSGTPPARMDIVARVRSRTGAATLEAFRKR